MLSTLVQDAVRYVGFTAEDAARLRAAAPALERHLPEMADRFYASLLAHPRAMRVFSSPIVVDRLKGTLQTWARELLRAPRDADYATKRARIGEVHVEIGLDQRYVIGAIGMIRDFLQARARTEGGPEAKALGAALGRACDLDLMLITESYQDATRLKNLRATLEREVEREKMAALGTLAAGLAHEVGNPLASISAICQIIERKGPDERLGERIRTIRDAIDRIDGLVRRVLDFARTRREAEEASVEVDLAASIGRVCDLLAVDKRMKGSELVRDVPADLRVLAPRAGLEQVLLNLILNAVEATGTGGRLAVRARREDGNVRVEVEDDGPGFSEEALTHAPEPFYTTKDDGTGLGLAISYGILRRSGGSLAVENRPPPARGGRVTVILPAAS